LNYRGAYLVQWNTGGVVGDDAVDISSRTVKESTVVMNYSVPGAAYVSLMRDEYPPFRLI
jgi:hypothetical protein